MPAVSGSGKRSQRSIRKYLKTEYVLARYLSITFDDGLFTGALKALRVLDRFNLPACFYLVTDWVGSPECRIRDHCNVNRDHGSWNEWRRIARAGHDIGSHSVSHIDASGWWARLAPWRLRRELQDSHDIIFNEVGIKPASIAMPYGNSTRCSDAFVRRIYRACRLTSGQPIYNSLSSVDWWRLAAWEPGSEPPFAICRTIDEVPDNHWMILNFHSLDDEGWRPISSAAFEEVVIAIAEQRDLQVVTPAQVVGGFAAVRSVGASTGTEENRGLTGFGQAHDCRRHDSQF